MKCDQYSISTVAFEKIEFMIISKGFKLTPDAIKMDLT